MGPPDTETDVAEYSDVLSKWQPAGLVDHFPQSLPPTATHVRFSSYPGYMQGGAHIQLRMELPSSEVKSLHADASKKAKQFHDGGNGLTLVNGRDDGLASADPQTLGSGIFEFPPDYRVFIFDAQPYKQGSGFDWNHGKSKGIVISLDRNEVIYYAQSW